jgi:hypothetical protein
MNSPRVAILARIVTLDVWQARVVVSGGAAVLGLWLTCVARHHGEAMRRVMRHVVRALTGQMVQQHADPEAL